MQLGDIKDVISIVTGIIAILGFLGLLWRKISKKLEVITVSLKRLDTIEKEVVGNERDRLKHVIFEFGNRARKKDSISGEEFRYLGEVFEKYSDEPINGNGIAHDEYVYIKDYYNSQSHN